MNTLDLFTGIGGFSYALANICKPIAYCDISEHARQCIENNIKNKLLPKAPIYKDVKDIKDTKAECIVAGFPCTDISIMNVEGKGLSGDRSGLFFEILRIIDASPSVKCVFMENSPNIKHKGLKKLVKEFERRKFEVRWDVFSAAEIGALHRRKRWYCLCTRGDFTAKTVHEPVFNWSREIVPRVIPKDANTKINTTRCSMLGNAVVPQCVRHAWNSLITGTHKTQQTQFVNIHLKDNFSEITYKQWATPCFTRWLAYSKITPRGSQLLVNQLFYDIRTKITEKDKNKFHTKYIANPRFVEWLMGYPQGWTS